MCNAWNHPPGCNCTFSGGWKGGASHNYNLSRISSLTTCYAAYSVTNQGLFSTAIIKAKTYPTTCLWCGASIYYHTNGYGDSVLFDDLGHPWQVHPCWTEHWSEEKERRRSSLQSLRLKPIILEQNLPPNQLKYLVLVGAAHSLCKAKKVLTEENVAQQLGLKPEQFLHDYHGLYERYLENKIRMLRLVEPI